MNAGAAAVRPLRIQKLFPYQQEVKDAPHQFKLLQWGRRTGKSRCAVHCSVTGHGRHNEDGHPQWEGLAQGRNVLWLGPDYTQLSTVWREEIEPRFGNADGCSININEMTAWLGDARLIMRTAKRENFQALRGMGENLGGIVVDEAAHLDLEELMLKVVLPMTLDMDGWIMFPSTTNSGSDTHVNEEGNKRTPSYYNILCEQQRDGNLPEWFRTQHDARSNPRIKPSAFARLCKQYDNQPHKLKEEVFADLLRGGVGFAFPELADVHEKVQSPEVVEEVIAGCDWGWSAHGYLGVLGLHKRGVHLLHEYPFNGPIDVTKRVDPDQAGFNAGRLWLHALSTKQIPQLPHIVYCDSAMDAVTDGGMSQMQLLQGGLQRALGDRAPACIPAAKGPGSRRMRKSLLHTLLRFTIIETENGDKVMVEAPRFTYAPTCPFFRRTTGSLVVDPKDPEDVDTTGSDHAYDAVTYGLLMAFPDLVPPANPNAARAQGSRDGLSRREEADYEAATDPDSPKAAPSHARNYGGAL